MKGICTCILLSWVTMASFAMAQTAPATKPAGTKTVVGDLIESGTDANGEIRLLVNRSKVITTSRPYKRLSVAQSELAAVNPLNPTSFLLTAKQAGSSQLIVWDEQDRSQVIELTIGFDTKTLQEQLRTLYPDADIQPMVWNNGITLTGRVPNLEVAEQAAQIAASYGPRVINLLKLPAGQQISLQVKFAEVSRSALSQLGVNLGYSDGRSFGANTVGPFGAFNVVGDAVSGASQLGILTPNPAVTVFGKALVGDTAVGYFLSALRQNNLARILAEPNLTTSSGQEARFLAGGDFPVPVVQGASSSGGATSLTVEYREFGVKLSFVPVVLGEGKIRLKISPEISDVDFTNAVRSSGFLIPGRRTRNLTTTVELASGQTFAVAGLLDNRVTSSKDVTPMLGDLPVLGALFRSVRYQRNETELVVLVTPRVVEPLNPSEVPAVPGEQWRHPSEVDIFLNADIGGPIATTQPARPPALYLGAHGLVEVKESNAHAGK
jgi:pilus assembly protein CpaC